VEAAGARLVVMPEFLREGNAVHDSKYPSRVVVGSRTAEARKAAMDLLAAGPTSGLLGMISDAFSERVSGPKVFEMGPGEAAVVKLASNAVLALHVAVGGAVASWVGSTPGGDAAAVLRAIDADPRVGRIGRPGLGAAGPCLPKDAGQASRTLGLPIRDLVRSHQEQVIRHLARRIYNSNCSRVVISGVGFKPDSKDWRSSPVEDLVRAMIARGVSPASIEVIDSRLTASELARVREEWMRSVTYSNAAGCDVTGAAVVLCGAPLIDPEGNPAVVFDPYVLMAAEAVSIWRQRGTRYIGGGRGECWGLPKAKAGAA
jgi:UDPglucose 6-dehydrogenase